MPDGEQQRNMRRFAGSCRFVFNKALALQQAHYAESKKKLSYADLCKQLTEWRKSSETQWLSETHSQPLQQTLKDLERAYKNFFEKRADFPRFKKKGQSDNFRYPQGCKLDQGNSRIFLPKLGWVRYRNSREVLGIVKNVTVSGKQGKWYVSIQTEREVEAPIHPSTAIVGIDMGIARFATLSDGSYFAPLNSFKRQEKALVNAQRAMSRKRSSATTGKRQKPKSRKSMPISAMPDATTCTKPRPRSAKTTRWCVSRTCRFGICPSQHQALPRHRAETSRPNPA